MSASSATESTRLSHAQEALLGPYLDFWKLVRSSTAPADHSAAESGVAIAYAAAGLAPPDRIVWCQSPIGIERSRKAAWYEFDPGPSVKTRVVDGVLSRVGSSVDTHVPVRVRVAAASGLEVESQYFSASGALSAALAEEASRIRWSGRARSKALWARLTRRPVRPYAVFEECRWLQHEAVNSLAKCAFLHNVYGATTETSALHGLWLIATSAGAMVPHERVCWLSDRHETLAIDNNGRLHCATGPAVRYPDGWSFYSWKGVAVPRWMIEQREQITPNIIDRERNPIIRHCMIDIMTPERFIASGAATRMADDKAGVLWRRHWLDWSDAWAAVEVINGTPEPDGTRKHYFLQVPPDLRTPIEAVAWTYGMTAKRYASLNLRT